MNTCIPFYFRHAITAAHCICEFKIYDPKLESAVYCLDASKNQITNDNTVSVAGGSNSAKVLDNPDWQFYWDIKTAYIKDNDVSKHDIGILELDGKYTHKFFDPDVLIYHIQQEKAEIIPICLGAVNLDTKINSSTIINQLGWGLIYEESPADRITDYQLALTARSPIYSTCMTSQASPLPWRFQNCDMQRLKVLGQNGKYKWECEKNKPPPDYKDGKAQRCEGYFDMAGKVKDKLDRLEEKTLSETILKNVDLIHVNRGADANDEKVFLKQDKCYNPNLLSTFGWCYLRDFKDRLWKGGDAWGICSPSCDYMQVSSFKYWKIFGWSNA